jgi:hypothetical protein
MWILHPSVGFLSVVEKPWDRANGILTIRARVHDDLVRLKTFLPSMGSMIESLDSDYRYRAVAKREAVMAAMAKLAADIDYDNFKNEVAARQGYERAAIYGDVWQVLYRLQRGHRSNPLFPD